MDGLLPLPGRTAAAVEDLRVRRGQLASRRWTLPRLRAAGAEWGHSAESASDRTPAIFGAIRCETRPLFTYEKGNSRQGYACRDRAHTARCFPSRRHRATLPPTPRTAEITVTRSTIERFIADNRLNRVHDEQRGRTFVIRQGGGPFKG